MYELYTHFNAKLQTTNMEIVYTQAGLQHSCLVLLVVVSNHGNSVNFHFSCMLFNVSLSTKYVI
jgi:hypothetical protein